MKRQGHIIQTSIRLITLFTQISPVVLDDTFGWKIFVVTTDVSAQTQRREARLTFQWCRREFFCELEFHAKVSTSANLPVLTARLFLVTKLTSC